MLSVYITGTARAKFVRKKKHSCRIKRDVKHSWSFYDIQLTMNDLWIHELSPLRAEFEARQPFRKMIMQSQAKSKIYNTRASEEKFTWKLEINNWLWLKLWRSEKPRKPCKT